MPIFKQRRSQRYCRNRKTALEALKVVHKFNAVSKFSAKFISDLYGVHLESIRSN